MRENNMKRKSLLILALLIAALASLVTSCSASVEPPKSEESMAYVTFGNGGSRSLYTEYGITSYDSLFWDYDAVKMDGYGTTGAATKAPVSKDPSNNQITGLSGTVGPLSQGAWEFTLYAYETVNGAKSDNLVYQGKSDVVVLKGGETKAVPVSVELKGEKGTLNFTYASFSWDESGGTGDVYLRINIKGNADNSTAIDATRIAKVTNSEGYKIKSALDFGYGVNLFPAGYYTCTVQAYVEGDLNTAKTDVTSDSTYKASQSFGLRVYGNAITYIKGNLEESLFADIIFDVEKQEMKVFTPIAGAETTVPDIAVTPSGESGKTSVTFSSGALPSLSVGETLQLDVRVTPLQSSNQKFEISGTTEDNKSAFAGIDITLWKTGSSGSEQVSNFGTQTATVTTYIEKNLSNVSVHYKKTASDAANIKTVYAIETIADETGTVTIPEGKDGVYYQDTGKLVFVTTHFSEYYVLAECEAVITSANVGYASIHDAVAAAAKMSSQVDNTVTLTRNVNLSKEDLKLGAGERGVSLNLNGKTINGGSYQVYTAGSGITTIFGDGVITNTNSTQTADSAPLRIYAGSNVVLDGVTVIGDYCGVKNSGNLTIMKATIEGTIFGLGCFGKGTTNIGVSGGNDSDVSITAKEQALATAAYTGLSDMVVNVYCGTFTTTGTEWDDCPAYWAGHGTLNIYGGTFSNNIENVQSAGILQKNGTVNIHGGSFQAKDGIKIVAQGDSTEITTAISGGSFTGTRSGIYIDASNPTNMGQLTSYSVCINDNDSCPKFIGGSEGAIYTKTRGLGSRTLMTISGGQFYDEDPAEYVAPGYSSEHDIGDNVYTVVSGVKNFKSLQITINDFANSNSKELIIDCSEGVFEFEEPINITLSNKKLTVIGQGWDKTVFKGFGINGSKSGQLGLAFLFKLYGDSNVHFEGIKFEDFGRYDTDGKPIEGNYDNYGQGIYVSGSSDNSVSTIIKDCSFSGLGGRSFVSVGAGNITIEGCVFNAEDRHYSTINVIEIFGGKEVKVINSSFSNVENMDVDWPSTAIAIFDTSGKWDSDSTILINNTTFNYCEDYCINHELCFNSRAPIPTVQNCHYINCDPIIAHIYRSYIDENLPDLEIAGISSVIYTSYNSGYVTYIYYNTEQGIEYENRYYLNDKTIKSDLTTKILDVSSSVKITIAGDAALTVTDYLSISEGSLLGSEGAKLVIAEGCLIDTQSESSFNSGNTYNWNSSTNHWESI